MSIKKKIKKKKRARSFKCDICEKAKKDVKEQTCPMTLKYERRIEKIFICDKCYMEAVQDDEDERLP